MASAVRSDPDLADTRLVLVTSLHSTDELAHARAAGIAAYMSKPVKRTDKLLWQKPKSSLTQVSKALCTGCFNEAACRLFSSSMRKQMNGAKQKWPEPAKCWPKARTQKKCLKYFHAV
jgi:DNA-binding NarL/FixJ family response regulator